MDLYQRLTQLTDAEAELCLNGVLKGLVEMQPIYADLLASPQEMATIIRTVASGNEQAHSMVGEPTPQDRPKAIRVILTEIAEDPTLSPRLEAWLNTARPKLLDPVTSALVLAGIILLLSTHVNIEYEDQNGKKKFKVKVEKKPTDNKILEKFFNFFR
jgi:hypothetical protein